MVRLHNNGMYGDRPFLYRKEKTRILTKEVWVQHYNLYTSDSFETGDGYSMHLTLEKAEKFKSPYSWWWKGGKPHKAYISKKTLENLLKEKKQTVFLTSDW